MTIRFDGYIFVKNKEGFRISCEPGDVCNWSRHTAGRVTFGRELRASIDETKCVLNWGTNPYQSQPRARHTWARMKERGTKIIVIDPRVTYEAKMADLHLRPRPGHGHTDVCPVVIKVPEKLSGHFINLAEEAPHLGRAHFRTVG